MSSQPLRACGGRLNPWNYEATPVRKGVVASLVTAAAIAAIVGSLAILASSGVNLHALNTLSVLTIQGGAALAATTLFITAIGIAWLATKSSGQKKGAARRNEFRDNPPNGRQPVEQPANGPRPLPNNGAAHSGSQQPPLLDPQAAFRAEIPKGSGIPPAPLFDLREEEEPSSSGSHPNVKEAGSPSAPFFDLLEEEPSSSGSLPNVRSPLAEDISASRISSAEPAAAPRLIPPYEPLEQLKLRRVELLAPLPAGDKLEAPESFPALERKKEEVGMPEVTIRPEDSMPPPPSEKVQLERQRNFFRDTTLPGYVDSLIQKAEHPNQIEMVMNFAKEQLDAFNKALSEHADVAVDPIEFDAFMEGYAGLYDETKGWSRLLEIASAPMLGEEQLGMLAKIAAPARLQPQFQEVLRRIAAKPTTEPDYARMVFTDLRAKFAIADLPIPLNPDKLFVEQLTWDIQKLFQYESKEDETPPLELEHLAQIRAYIHSEELRFFETYRIEIDAYKEFSDMEILEEAWTIMNQLVRSTDGIDRKIEMLADFAEKLPAANAILWNKYHVIKDCIGLDLTKSFAFRFFASYQFNLPLSPEDVERKVRLDSAFELMAKKLGCEKPEIPVIEMDTTSDIFVCEGEFERECQTHAQFVQAAFGTFGAEIAAGTLKSRIASLGFLQNEYAKGILKALPVEISDHLTPYLADILFD